MAAAPNIFAKMYGISSIFVILLTFNIIGHHNHQANGQSNYASQANNIGYQGEGLPEEATLDGKVSELSHF